MGGAGTFVFDRFSESHVHDPYPLYRRAREQAPVCYAEAFGVWVVTRHSDVRTVLTDVERFSSAFGIRTPLVAADGVREILLTDLVTAGNPADADGRFSTAELVSLLLTLIFGGHETTANLIGSALLQLLGRPGLVAAVAADPARADPIIEETLRADPPVQGSFRRVVAETELSGVRLPAGAQVFAVIGSANRDPAATDDPDTFDPARGRPDRHLAFGRGIHFCIGAALARLQARTVITTLVRRLPGIRLADGFHPPYPANLLHRGPTRLDAVWPR